MRELHDGDRFRFEILADLSGVDTGTEMQVVYHLYSVLDADWLASSRRGCHATPARSLGHLPVDRRRVGRT